MSKCYIILLSFFSEVTKMARVLISMTDDFLSRIDEIANDEQRTRSELVREALRTYMRRNRNINNEKASKNAETLENLLD